MAAPIIAAAVASKMAENKWTPIVLGVIIVGAGVGLYFITRPVLEFAGVIATKEERKIRKSKALDPSFWKGHIGKLTISTSKASAIANTIYRACDACRGNVFGETLVGDFLSGAQNENADVIVRAIIMAGNKYNLSKVSDVFQKTWGESLAKFLKSVGNEGSEKIYAALNQIEKR